MKTLSLAFTTCPNDTFTFYGLVCGAVPRDFDLRVEMADIQTLNDKAADAVFDVTKLSSFAYAKAAQDYVILRSGAALGHGCGPLLLSRAGRELRKDSRVAVPGEWTTANLLLKLFLGNIETVAMRFDLIMPAMQNGEIDHGVVIHEGRFTYREYGLELIQDLGDFWERCFNLPIPLGFIVARRSLGSTLISQFERSLADSIAYARNHREAVLPYVKSHSQEMDDEVVRRHIDTYVTEESDWLSENGKESIRLLLDKAAQFGLAASFPSALYFLED